MDEAFRESDKYINKKCGLHIEEYQKNIDGCMCVDKQTKCAKHKHITKEEYLQAVSKIINEFLENGFDKVIERYHPKYDNIKLYNSLKEKKVSIEKITAQVCSHSNKIIKAAMYKHFYDVKDFKGTNYKSLWNREILEKVFNKKLTATKFKPDIPKGQGETIFANIASHNSFIPKLHESSPFIQVILSDDKGGITHTYDINNRNNILIIQNF